AIQGSDDAPLHAAFLEGLAAFQGAVALDQHFCQAGHIEAAQTIAQPVIAEAAITADPVLQVGSGQIRLQLLEAGQPEDKTVEGSQKNRLWGDVRSLPRILQTGGGSAEIEDLVEIASQRGDLMGGVVFV